MLQHELALASATEVWGDCTREGPSVPRRPLVGFTLQRYGPPFEEADEAIAGRLDDIQATTTPATATAADHAEDADED